MVRNQYVEESSVTFWLDSLESDNTTYQCPQVSHLIAFSVMIVSRS
jgi:hypothetical protein